MPGNHGDAELVDEKKVGKDASLPGVLIWVFFFCRCFTKQLVLSCLFVCWVLKFSYFFLYWALWKSTGGLPLNAAAVGSSVRRRAKFWILHELHGNQNSFRLLPLREGYSKLIELIFFCRLLVCVLQICFKVIWKSFIATWLISDNFFTTGRKSVFFVLYVRLQLQCLYFPKLNQSCAF